MAAKKKAGDRRALERKQVLKEAEWWAALGALVQPNWKEARMIGPGRAVTMPKDFFGDPKAGQAGFDLIAVFPKADRGRGATAWIQVTSSPFVQERSGKADRNAAHGAPPFPWSEPPMAVDVWASSLCACYPERSLEGFASVQVIVSYAEKKAVRRWWVQQPRGESCAVKGGPPTTLDSFVEA